MGRSTAVLVEGLGLAGRSGNIRYVSTGWTRWIDCRSFLIAVTCSDVKPRAFDRSRLQGTSMNSAFETPCKFLFFYLSCSLVLSRSLLFSLVLSCFLSSSLCLSQCLQLGSRIQFFKSSGGRRADSKTGSETGVCWNIPQTSCYANLEVCPTRRSYKICTSRRNGLSRLLCATLPTSVCGAKNSSITIASISILLFCVSGTEHESRGSTVQMLS